MIPRRPLKVYFLWSKITNHRRRKYAVPVQVLWAPAESVANRIYSRKGIFLQIQNERHVTHFAKQINYVNEESFLQTPSGFYGSHTISIYASSSSFIDKIF